MKRATAALLRKMPQDQLINAWIRRRNPTCHYYMESPDSLQGLHSVTPAEALDAYLKHRAQRPGVFMVIEDAESGK